MTAAKRTVGFEHAMWVSNMRWQSPMKFWPISLFNRTRFFHLHKKFPQKTTASIKSSTVGNEALVGSNAALQRIIPNEQSSPPCTGEPARVTKAARYLTPRARCTARLKKRKATANDTPSIKSRGNMETSNKIIEFFLGKNLAPRFVPCYSLTMGGADLVAQLFHTLGSVAHS